MRWVRPTTWIAVISALLVVGVVWIDRTNTSPGELSAAHAQDPRLADQDCAQCHGEERGSMARSCSTCHAEIAEQLEKHTGFHGTLSGAKNDAHDCAGCHSEHRGADLKLVSKSVFAKAGVADVEHFDHAHVEFGLEGRHATLACKDCHPHAEVDLLKKGDKRFLGLSQSCESCHEDVHAGQLPECASCHGQEHPFAQAPLFEHSKTFPLEGAHAGNKCTDCHPKGSEHAIEAERASLTGRARDVAVRACRECHPAPHAESFLAAVAAEKGVAPASSCETCHPTSHKSFTGEALALTVAEHAWTGFVLDAPHDKVACRDCHVPAARADESVEQATFAAFRSAYPGRTAEQCSVCHGDPHAGQFTRGPFANASCTSCHSKAHFLPASFELAQHARTSFALTGAHAAVACERCHREQRPLVVQGREHSMRVFEGTSTRCRDCHADVHEARFDVAASAPATSAAGSATAPAADCERCHTTESFTQLAQPFDHGRFTSFALDGAHLAARCETCHAPRAKPDDNGRSFGRVAERFPGDATSCATCHRDVHAGAFDLPSLPRAVAGAQGCARCHTTASFQAADKGFDHAQWTGFALVGAHERAACETCHARSSTRDANGRSFGRASVAAKAARSECTSCHADVHNGAFDAGGRRNLPATVDGRASCLRCHTQNAFSDARSARFEHATWTGFALDGSHSKLECASCHEPVLAADGSAKRFGLARGTNCSDCHVDPHVAQFAKDGRTDCASCHTTQADFHVLDFDHDRDSRFPLDKTHRPLACSACHRPSPLPDGTSAVRYKPLGTTCGDCHVPGGKIR